MSEAEAREEAQRVATGRGFTERLAETIGAAARASAVFGEPVEGQGVTVIPVARAKWGFGGGSGGTTGSKAREAAGDIRFARGLHRGAFGRCSLPSASTAARRSPRRGPWLAGSRPRLRSAWDGYVYRKPVGPAGPASSG